MLKVIIFLVFGSSLVLGENQLYKFSDEYIDRINKEADTWQAGRNFPANISEEYLREHLIADAKYFHEFEWPLASDRKTFDPQYSATENIPATFDARQQWPKCTTIGIVPDVGACATPHIYAAVGAFSDRRCIKSGGQNNVELSTEYVVSCCKNCRYDEKKTCYHGSLFKTWNFLHRRGSVTGGRYGERTGCQPASIKPCSHFGSSPSLPSCETLSLPAPQCHTRCTNRDHDKGFFQDKHKTTWAYWVNDKEDDIKKEILAHGPVTAAFVLYDDFYHYKSGVYKHTDGAKEETYFHSAKIIGWGTTGGSPYWLLVNNWGPLWGDKGTFKILRGKYECGIEYTVAGARPKN